MSKASFCLRTSKSRVLNLRVATGLMLLEKTNARPLSITERMTKGRMTLQMEMPEAFMATSS